MQVYRSEYPKVTSKFQHSSSQRETEEERNIHRVQTILILNIHLAVWNIRRVQTILILKEIYGSLRVPSYTLKLEKVRTQKGVLIPLDYWRLAGLASEEDDAHSAITESYTFSAFVDDKLAANMAGMHAMDYCSMLKVRSSKCNKNQSMRLKIC